MILERFACIAVTGALLALVTPTFAHGGQYRGPGDTVPPNPGGDGGNRGRPGGPVTPGPSGPSAPGPRSPGSTGGRAGTPTTPGSGPGGPGTNSGPGTPGGGAILDTDLTQWQFWWEFNKDRFLQLKSRLHDRMPTTGSDDYELGRGHRGVAARSLAPSDEDRRTKMLPVLLQALKHPASNRDIVSSCMIALAKIGASADPVYYTESILPEFVRFLPDRDQEKRETAALAMGIAALPAAVPHLLALAKDDAAGRELVQDRGGVDYRTRAFACYGLGLIAYRSRDPELKLRIFETMRELLGDDGARRDLQVAALNAIRLLRPSSEGDTGHELERNVVAFCTDFLERKDVYDQIRAHAISAMAKVLENSSDEALRVRVLDRCLEILDPTRSEARAWTQQSAVQALGVLGTPEDARVIDVLQRYHKDGKDLQARNFCALAIGQIGGSDAREFLYRQLRSESVPKMIKPWVALGLAVRDFELRAANPTTEVDKTVCDGIRLELGKNNYGLFAASYAIALGMMRCTEAGDELTERLLAIQNQEEAAGYFMVGLGLMRHYAARNDILEIVRGATRREHLLRQGTIALGLLGDETISNELVKKIEEQGPVAVMSALAQALGFIGDRHSIAPLVAVLENQSLQPLSRAFAAVALGLVGDKEQLPWNSKISADLNYRANVETLTSTTGTGVLDIL